MLPHASCAAEKANRKKNFFTGSIMEREGHNILIYSDKLASFEYGENHPFKPMRAKQFLELLNRYSLIFEQNQQIIEPTSIAEELLYLFRILNKLFYAFLQVFSDRNLIYFDYIHQTLVYFEIYYC